MHSYWIPVLTALLFVTSIFAQQDTSLQARAVGKDVVDVVIKRIDRGNIFKDDKNILRRIACAETQYGTNPVTFSNGNFGGIWQVNEADFNRTKDNERYRHLTVMHNDLWKTWGIKWKNLQHSELLKPFYSGLAARLLLSLPEVGSNLPIPGTISLQANYWKAYYNPSGNVTAFQTAATAETCEAKCPGRLDICIMMDASNSVQPRDFALSRIFVKDLLESFEGGSTRAALVVFSSSIVQTFPLDTNMTWAEKKAAALNPLQTPHLQQNTFTAAAIKYCINMFNTTFSVVSGVPKISLLLTDGQSNDPGPATVANTAPLAAAAGITTFAVGVGPGPTMRELLLIADNQPDRVHDLSDFQNLAEFFGQLNQETCAIPQIPLVNETTTDSLIQGERRYFKFVIGIEGLVITVQTTSGQTAVYYSYTETTPSAALNDGKIEGTGVIPYRVPSTTPVPGELVLSSWSFRSDNNTDPELEVYISVTGLDERNNYTIQAKTYVYSASNVNRLNGYSGLCIALFCYLASFIRL